MAYTAALLFGQGEEKSLVDMIGKYFIGRQERSFVRRGSVESCDDISPHPNMDAGVEQEERLLQQDVTRHIERCLTEAKASVLHCEALLLPRQMTARVGRDVLSAATDEPCGLRGASIRVYVETKDGVKSLGNIRPDPDVTSTFELSLVLKAHQAHGWPPLKHIFDGNKVMKLRPEYKLVKRKLYSSASPVIHQFN
ncbi:DNA damage-inducible transcript 4-like protein-like [Entelurus aequoreus]|uniref:DNA damage-inducible transcript 4-like protein-like n=1 Tax=Entelurus aequoreus TaxID=161455 RepID=UPI002B1E6624|nr:DNA damage-inducible transcript 4-like protein-like [Entelurus aequoreus]